METKDHKPRNAVAEKLYNEVIKPVHRCVSADPTLLSSDGCPYKCPSCKQRAEQDLDHSNRPAPVSVPQRPLFGTDTIIALMDKVRQCGVIGFCEHAEINEQLITNALHYSQLNSILRQRL